MTKQCIAVLALTFVLPIATWAEGDVRQFVVKVSAEVSPPDPLNPWRKMGTGTSVGSGVIIEGGRILTAAHVVTHAVRIDVQRRHSSKRFRASIVAIAPEIDLALLTVNDPNFFPAHASGLGLSTELPQPQDRVQVHGFPASGETLKSSTVVCGRTEYSSETLLVELDGTITPGYSGGPCLMKDKLVGILLLRSEGEASGFMIPSAEISMFTADAADGHYDGKPSSPHIASELSNKALRRRLRVPDEVTGGLIFYVHPIASDKSPLVPGDVLTKIGDYQVDNNGKVLLSESGLYVDYSYLIPLLAKNGRVDVTVFRGGKLQKLELATIPSTQVDMLLCPSLSNRMPSYFVWGPLVFSTVYQETSDLIMAQAFSDGAAASVFAKLVMTGSPLLEKLALNRTPGKRVVFVVDRISHDTLTGYGDMLFEVVDKVDTERVLNLAHLAALLRQADNKESEYVILRFDNPFFGPVVLDREAAKAATDQTQDTLGIRRPCSPDLLDTAAGDVTLGAIAPSVTDR